MKFLAEDDALTITFEGSEVFFAMKRKLVIPRAAITDLQWQPDFTLNQRMWRVAGTDLPSSLWAGRFRGGGKRYFLYIRGPRGLTWRPSPQRLQNVLDISLQAGGYDKILLTCQPDIGASLLNWWQAAV